MGEPHHHGSHAAVDDELIHAVVDDHDPALLLLQNLADGHADFLDTLLALGRSVGAIGIQTHFLGGVPQQSHSQDGDDDQDNAQADVEGTIVTAQVVGDEVAHHRGAHHGEQGGAQGDDAQDTATIPDEPSGSQLESGHLQAHAGAADHKQAHSIQPVNAVDVGVIESSLAQVDAGGVAGQAVGHGDAQAAQSGQTDAGDQSCLLYTSSEGGHRYVPAGHSLR